MAPWFRVHPFFFGSEGVSASECPLYRTYSMHVRTRSRPAFRKLTKLTLPPDCLLFVARQSQSVSIILHRIPPFAPHLPSRPRTRIPIHYHSFTLYLVPPVTFFTFFDCLTPTSMGSAASRPRQIIPKSLSHQHRKTPPPTPSSASIQQPSGTSPFFLSRSCLSKSKSTNPRGRFPIQFSQLITFLHISQTIHNERRPWIWR